MAVSTDTRGPARTGRLRLAGDAAGPPLTIVTLMAPPGPGGHAPDVVVAIGGEVDVATAPRLRAELSMARALRPDRLIVDLGGVTFMDAAGLSALLSPARAGDVRVTLIARPGRVRRLLELVGADRAVEVLDSVPQAPGEEPGDLTPAA